jgi:hypothetical protein
MTTVTKGLVIDDPWIELILSGSKTWEMRSTKTSFRSWFGLIRKGSGAVWGVARLDDVGATMTPDEMVATVEKHRILEAMIRSGAIAKWNTPWKLADSRRFARPVPYRHPYGAVTWVSLDAAVTEIIAAQLAGSDAQPEILSAVSIDRSPSAPARSSVTGMMPPPPTAVTKASLHSALSGETTSAMIGETEVTQGNVDNYHFYMRPFLNRFPGDLIGGPNKGMAATSTAIVDWGGPSPVETDIDGEKKFFRKRSWVRQFFRDNDVEPGDKVRVEETAPYHYRVRLLKRD